MIVSQFEEGSQTFIPRLSPKVWQAKCTTSPGNHTWTYHCCCQKLFSYLIRSLWIFQFNQCLLENFQFEKEMYSHFQWQKDGLLQNICWLDRALVCITIFQINLSNKISPGYNTSSSSRPYWRINWRWIRIRKNR